MEWVYGPRTQAFSLVSGLYRCDHDDARLSRPILRLHLLTALIRHLDDRYVRLRAGERQRLFEDWRGRLTTLGRPVIAESAGRAIEGHAEDTTPDGSPVVHDHAGTLHELTAGDVTVRNQ